MSDSSRKPAAISRRRFMASVAAGSAALLAHPLAAAAATARRAARKASAPPSEFNKQRASTLATLKTIRAQVLPPGGDLGAVFHPLRSRRGGK
ncbi:MAG: hypothetical protein ABIU54_13065 [Candidatus Eisenbacteria bacterium]